MENIESEMLDYFSAHDALKMSGDANNINNIVSDALSQIIAACKSGKYKITLTYPHGMGDVVEHNLKPALKNRGFDVSVVGNGTGVLVSW